MSLFFASPEFKNHVRAPTDASSSGRGSKPRTRYLRSEHTHCNSLDWICPGQDVCTHLCDTQCGMGRSYHCAGSGNSLFLVTIIPITDRHAGHEYTQSHLSDPRCEKRAWSPHVLSILPEYRQSWTIFSYHRNSIYFDFCRSQDLSMLVFFTNYG